MPESIIVTSANDINSNPLNQAIENAIPPAGVREVLRCAQCQLVQYRTASDLCRRCNRALPRPLDFAEIASREEESAAIPGGQPGERVTPLSTAEYHGKTIRNFSLGPRLRELREFASLTQSDIARRAGVPRTYVSRIEHGHLLPGLGVTQRLADALGVGILDLVPSAVGGKDVSSGDPFWCLLAANFGQLRIEEQALVLTRVRALVRRREMNAA